LARHCTEAGLTEKAAARIEGTCIKRRFGSASIKMYDKFG
jgi:hypothetical protein